MADEVRTLAGKTEEATKEIIVFVKEIRSNANTTNLSFEKMLESMQIMRTSLDTASGVIDEVVNLADEMTSIINNSSAGKFIELIKMDHMLYKLEIYKVIFGLSNKIADDFTSHNQCRLGKWYYEGEGSKLFSTSNEFKSLESPHKQVNGSGTLAFQTNMHGQRNECLNYLSEMEQSSEKVIEILNKLETEYSKVLTK